LATFARYAASAKLKVRAAGKHDSRRIHCSGILALSCAFCTSARYYQAYALFRYVFGGALLMGFTYFGLWVADPKSSIFAVLDFYVFGALLGILGAMKCLWLCVRSFNIKTCLLALVGALLAFVNLWILCQDFFEPRVVLEARTKCAHSVALSYLGVRGGHRGPKRQSDNTDV
jgi:hypothetical protein